MNPTLSDSLGNPGSITRVVASLRHGKEEAATKLWEKYFSRMVAVAFAKFGRHRGRTGDAEDVALSALGHFCQDVAEGRLPWVKDRGSLWPVLVTITARRAARLSRDELREKRNAKRLESCDLHSLHLVSRTLPPDESLLLEEQVQILLNKLTSPLLRNVAILKLEGLNNEQVGQQLGISLRSVERKLQIIRDLWSSPSGEGDST